jgi:hypothetical protein
VLVRDRALINWVLFFQATAARRGPKSGFIVKFFNEFVSENARFGKINSESGDFGISVIRASWAATFGALAAALSRRDHQRPKPEGGAA